MPDASHLPATCPPPARHLPGTVLQLPSVVPPPSPPQTMNGPAPMRAAGTATPAAVPCGTASASWRVCRACGAATLCGRWPAGGAGWLAGWLAVCMAHTHTHTPCPHRALPPPPPPPRSALAAASSATAWCGARCGPSRPCTGWVGGWVGGWRYPRCLGRCRRLSPRAARPPVRPPPAAAHAAAAPAACCPEQAWEHVVGREGQALEVLARIAAETAAERQHKQAQVGTWAHGCRSACLRGPALLASCLGPGSAWGNAERAGGCGSGTWIRRLAGCVPCCLRRFCFLHAPASLLCGADPHRRRRRRPRPRPPTAPPSPPPTAATGRRRRCGARKTPRRPRTANLPRAAAGARCAAARHM